MKYETSNEKTATTTTTAAAAGRTVAERKIKS